MVSSSFGGLGRSPLKLGIRGQAESGLELAHRLGLLTVAFNHDADAAADIYIEQFSQLGQLLDWQGHLDRQGSPEAGYSSAKAA